MCPTDEGVYFVGDVIGKKIYKKQLEEYDPASTVQELLEDENKEEEGKKKEDKKEDCLEVEGTLQEEEKTNAKNITNYEDALLRSVNTTAPN